jgi:fatty-acyl-CoA synthase
MGDVLRLGGFLVSPAEIEGRLIDHPAIEAAQVVSVDLVGGPKAVAFVTTTDDAADFDEQGVRQFCRDGLAGYKVPARIVALSEFPTTASANGTKIQKVKLRDHAASLFV